MECNLRLKLKLKNKKYHKYTRAETKGWAPRLDGEEVFTRPVAEPPDIAIRLCWFHSRGSSPMLLYDDIGEHLVLDHRHRDPSHSHCDERALPNHRVHCGRGIGFIAANSSGGDADDNWLLVNSWCSGTGIGTLSESDVPDERWIRRNNQNTSSTPWAAPRRRCRNEWPSAHRADSRSTARRTSCQPQS